MKEELAKLIELKNQLIKENLRSLNNYFTITLKKFEKQLNKIVQEEKKQ